MPFIKGQLEHKKWEKGERLTLKEAILAKCYDCNGFEEGGVDCDAGNGYEHCPLYEFMPYRKEIENIKSVVKIIKKRTEKQLAYDKKLREVGMGKNEK